MAAPPSPNASRALETNKKPRHIPNEKQVASWDQISEHSTLSVYPFSNVVPI